VVRAWKVTVDQVMDGDDPREATPGRRGGRERVDKIDPRGHREPRQQLLLAAHPLQAISDADRHNDLLD
jgi:hypothetical protein